MQTLLSSWLVVKQEDEYEYNRLWKYLATVSRSRYGWVYASAHCPTSWRSHHWHTGNFSVSTGKAKAKNTFNVCALVTAALINGQVLEYRASFPESKRDILYFDTEQSPYHYQLVMQRILSLAGLPLDQEPEHPSLVISEPPQTPISGERWFAIPSTTVPTLVLWLLME